jgi:hypothetical protein
MVRIGSPSPGFRVATAPKEVSTTTRCARRPGLGCEMSCRKATAIATPATTTTMEQEQSGTAHGLTPLGAQAISRSQPCIAPIGRDLSLILLKPAGLRLQLTP